MRLEAVLENTEALRMAVATMKFYSATGRFRSRVSCRTILMRFASPGRPFLLSVVTKKLHELFNRTTTDAV